MLTDPWLFQEQDESMEEAAAMYRREEKEDSVSPPHSENVGALLGTAYLTLCPDSSLWNSQYCEESWDMKKLSMNLENVTYKIMFPKIRKKCFSLKSYPNIANINNKNYKK